MNIQQLHYFVALAKSQHMTETAKTLNVTQPCLSYSISELEKELGVPLFKKVGRNIKLTRYGNIYYDYASKALETLQQGKQVIDEDKSPHYGTINLGFIYTQGTQNIPNVLKAFKSLYPNIHFNLTQSTSKQLLHHLQEEDIDLAITSQVDGFDSLEFLPLIEEEMVLVVPKNHPLANKTSLQLHSLKDYPLVYYNENSGLRPYLDHFLAKNNLNITKAIEVEDDQSILGFVAASYGPAIMPNIPSIAAYPVKTISMTDITVPRIIYLANHSQGYQSPAVKLFKDYCLDYFSYKESSNER